MSLDLAAIQSRLDRGVESLTDTYDLLREVERLRKHRESCTENLLKGYKTGKTEERAAVVAWLRKQRTYGTDDLLGAGFATVLCILAEAVEKGEHIREGEE